MYFFTADLHLGCDEILIREARPFSSIREFEDAFIERVNAVAGERDTLFVVGDWFNYNRSFKPPLRGALTAVRKINPQVALIMGNGEERIVAEMFHGDFGAFRAFCADAGMYDVMPDCELSFGGRDFYLNHYPKKHRDGYVNLFGHTHRATGLWKPYGLNVGVDLNCFRPFSEDDILDLLKTKEEWWDIDEDCRSM